MDFLCTKHFTPLGPQNFHQILLWWGLCYKIVVDEMTFEEYLALFSHKFKDLGGFMWTILLLGNETKSHTTLGLAQVEVS
jgi:hypothetical protein